MIICGGAASCVIDDDAAGNLVPAQPLPCLPTSSYTVLAAAALQYGSAACPVISRVNSV
jgi:hypothetical protein